MNNIKLYEQEMDCCGCSACKCICPKHAISMEENDEGFLYPIINDEKCVECGLCLKVCPVSNFEKPYLENKGENKIQIGILSLSDTENFGAKIVTYALQKKIEEIVPNANVNIIQFKADTVQDDIFTVIKDRIKKQGIYKPYKHYTDFIKNQKMHKKEFAERKVYCF